MINGKFLVTLVSIVVAIFAICNMNFGEKVVENWGMIPNRTIKVFREAKGPDGKFYGIPGTFQASPPPRFSNVDYGSSIKYNLPSNDHLAVPVEYGIENYAPPGCKKGGLEIPDSIPHSRKAAQMAANYAASNYNELRDKLHHEDITDVLPVGDMTTFDALGRAENAIVYDRYVYANAKSRLWGQGDPIRGDLPIAPCDNNGWFQVAVNPNIDLRGGALSVMGGINNETTNALHDLKNAVTGGVQKIMGGVDYDDVVNMGVDKVSHLSAFQNDLTVTAFP